MCSSFWLVSAFACLVLTLDGCRKQGPDGGQLPPKVTILPESELKMVLSPCSRDGPRDVTSTWTPTAADILFAETRLKDYVRTKLGQPLEKYYRQYIGIIIRGKKAVYLNAVEAFQEDALFEELHPKWRTEYMRICDGSDTVWGVEYYVEEQRLMNFETNGPVVTR